MSKLKEIKDLIVQIKKPLFELNIKKRVITLEQYEDLLDKINKKVKKIEEIIESN